MSLPLFPCPKKFTFWDTTLLPRGTFWVRVPRRPARGRPKAVFLLLACCTQEEDAGPAAANFRRISDLLVAAGEQEDLRPFFAPRERGRALGFSAIPMSQNGHVLGHDYEFALNFSSGSADLLVVVCISHKVAKPDGTFRWLVPCPELGHW
jgi:hypothetical protein